MGYKGVCVTRAMSYEGVDCIIKSRMTNLFCDSDPAGNARDGLNNRLIDPLSHRTPHHPTLFPPAETPAPTPTRECQGFVNPYGLRSRVGMGILAFSYPRKTRARDTGGTTMPSSTATRQRGITTTAEKTRREG